MRSFLPSFVCSPLTLVSFHHSYGYFKIASTASVVPEGPRPGFLSVTDRTKWDAWKSSGETIPDGASEEDIVKAAKLRYTNVVRVAMGAGELESLS